MFNTFYFDSHLGRLAITENGEALIKLDFAEISGGVDSGPISQLTDLQAKTAAQLTNLQAKTAEQLTEYFDGRRKDFDLPLGPQGTAFQQKVWEKLIEIPYGQTRSYKFIAEQVGNIAATRAVGQANHNNPLPIFIPCHRVIGSDGKLTGYTGGLHIMRFLLDLEKRNSEDR